MSGDDRAYLFYLLGFLLLIGFSVVSSGRFNFGKSLQQAAIWGLIFLGLIIGYGFKDVFLAQIDSGTPIVEDDGTIILSRASDGHFHADIVVNGVEVDFLVDTGASQIVLNKRDARRVGIDLDTLAFTGSASTANGIVRTARARVGVMKLGDVLDTDVRVSINDGELDSSLLGLTYLDRFKELRIIGDRMYLRR